MDERKKPLRYQRLEPIRYNKKASVAVLIILIVVVYFQWPLITTIYQAL